MPKTPSLKGKIVLRYLNEYPELTTTELANRIYSNDINKNHFKNVEDVRSTIRYYRGTKGKYNYSVLNKELLHKLPTGIKSQIKHHIIKGANKILLLSDIHVPYHDEIAINAAIAYGKKQKVDCIILNGDFIDFYSISRFETDHRKRNFSNEVTTAIDVLRYIRNQFKNEQIIYKVGNHDDRWQQFIIKNELTGLNEIELQGLLKFKELGIKMVDSMATIYANKLAIIHGHEHRYGLIAPVNPARGLFLRTKQSVIMSHVHRISEHTEKTHDGKLIGCWSTGCLCELTPDYMPYNNHNHGFAVIELQKNNMFTVYNKKIIDGIVY